MFFLLLQCVYLYKCTILFFLCVAVLMNDEYIVAGDGDIALNTTHPSPLEENHMIYNLYLTPDLLPHTEELILSGPISDKIHIQVGGNYCIITFSWFVFHQLNPEKCRG